MLLLFVFCNQEISIFFMGQSCFLQSTANTNIHFYFKAREEQAAVDVAQWQEVQAAAAQQSSTFAHDSLDRQDDDDDEDYC